jgi:hypothetical protein
MLPPAAYFRAVRLLEQFKSVEDWAAKLDGGVSTNDPKKPLRWPKDKQEEASIHTPFSRTDAYRR